jgi:uncharacterized protein YndB with AHSA1/START domain
MLSWKDDPVHESRPVREAWSGPEANEGDAMTTPADVDADNSGLIQNSGLTKNEAPTDQPVHIRLTVSGPVGAVWRALISPEGTAVWLGTGAVLGDKGQSYHCADGSAGVVRIFHPLEQLRLSWHHDADDEPSLIEVDVTPEGERTRLRLWHDGLAPEFRPAMQIRWQQRLEALAGLV